MGRLTRLAVIWLTVFGILLAGCSQPWILGGEGSAEGGEVLRLTAEAEPPNLDSAEAIDAQSITVLNNVMEGLMRLDKDQQPQPAMAEDVRVSDDRKTYIFKIRDNARWSDGEPVTAQDFEYAWKRALDPKKQLESAYILFPLKNARAYFAGKTTVDTVGVKAIDERTLRVKLEEPVPYFLTLTASAAYFPQRKDFIEKQGRMYAKDDNRLLYNGPFVLKDWKHDQSYRFVKNPEYWDEENVKLDEVQVRIVTDSMQAANDYNSGEVDMAPLSDELVHAFKGNRDFIQVDRGATFLILFNTRKKFFSNEKVRKAFSLAVDREQLVQDVLQNGSRPAQGMVPDSIQGSQKGTFRKQAGDQLAYDAARARQLLDQGMAELGMDKPPRIALNVNDNDRKKIALFLKEQFQNTLGIDILINPRPMKQKLEAEQQGRFQMSLVRWIGRYNDPMAFLEIGHSQSDVNFGQWSDSTFDRLIETANLNTDAEKRDQNLIKAESIVIEQAGVVPLFYEGQAYVQKPYVKNLYRSPVGAEYTLKWTYIDKPSKNR